MRKEQEEEKEVRRATAGILVPVSLFPLLPLVTSNVQISEISYVYLTRHKRAFSITVRPSLQMSPYIHSYCSIKQ